MKNAATPINSTLTGHQQARSVKKADNIANFMCSPENSGETNKEYPLNLLSVVTYRHRLNFHLQLTEKNPLFPPDVTEIKCR